MRILLVEDNRPLSDWLTRTLEQGGYAVECAYDGADADHRLLTQSYDIVILDLTLPRMRRLRKRDAHVPVLILTARDTVQGRVGGLDGGADDYMAKPFDVAKLEARLRVLLRRRANHRSPILRCGNLSFDSNTKLFSIGDVDLALTPREHALLEALMMKAGQTISKPALAETLFTLDENVSPDAIEIYVHRLRRKMQACDASIVTLRGLGYLLKHHGV